MLAVKLFSTGQDGVKFSPSAYLDPYYFLEFDETSSDVTFYNNYINRRTNINHKLQVKASYSITLAIIFK